MAGPRRRFVLLAPIAVLTTLGLLIGCGESSTASSGSPPAVSEKPATVEETQFAFAPTVQQHAAAADLEFRILLEVGNASEATLDVVTASFSDDREPNLRVELWTFDQRDKTKLEPKGDPQWLLPFRTEQAPDGGDQLARLRRALSLPNSIKTRPVGLAAESAEQALQRIAAASKTAMDTSAKAPDRLAAVETLFRGLGDDVFFDAKALPRVLAMATKGQLDNPKIESSSDRRATAGVGDSKLELLKTSGGWSITGLQ